MEDADGYKAKKGLNVYNERELITEMCETFCDKITEAGYKTGVYANKNYFDNVIITDDIKYPLWLAHWGIDEPSIPCLFWQYTSDGSVDGINGRVDMNYYYGQLPNASQEEIEFEEETTTKLKYSIGDEVEYNKIYSSSTSTEALTPTYTSGIITKVLEGKRNPYLINDGTGWVNDDCIVSTDTSSTESADKSISKGDKVKVLKNEQYSGGTFATYYDEYDVIQVKDDRIVIGKGSTITAAVAAKNLERV